MNDKTPIHYIGITGDSLYVESHDCRLVRGWWLTTDNIGKTRARESAWVKDADIDRVMAGGERCYTVLTRDIEHGKRLIIERARRDRVKIDDTIRKLGGDPDEIPVEEVDAIVKSAGGLRRLDGLIVVLHGDPSVGLHEGAIRIDGIGFDPWCYGEHPDNILDGRRDMAAILIHAKAIGDIVSGDMPVSLCVEGDEESFRMPERKP